MALTFKLYTDSGLTSEFTGPLTITQNSDGTSDPVDNVLYLGSTTASRKIEANSNPGVDQISISITDTTPGSGHEATEVKLATTLAGLDSATAGAALNVGTVINSGAGNAQAIWIRVDDATQTVGTATELGITTNTLKETATA